jgi:hypothetical protein
MSTDNKSTSDSQQKARRDYQRIPKQPTLGPTTTTGKKDRSHQ